MQRKLYWMPILLIVLIFPVRVLAQDQQCPTSQISFELNPLNWKEIDLLIPKFSTFTVIDLVTGQSFKVQRRAGSDHTDVQPLTKKDTKIMKEIYGGKWSWKRRAILVQFEDYLIPASMHGMPHGAGAIQNNFPGHFCVHFYGSSTHKKDTMDFSHTLMILKSAGQLEEYTARANPTSMVQIFIEALNQQDPYILNLLLTNNWKQNNELTTFSNDINTIKIKELETTLENAFTAEAHVKVIMYSKKQGRIKGTVFIPMVRDFPSSPWKIQHERIKPALE
ncbi:hypothetical protein [Bacillus sp. AK128]